MTPKKLSKAEKIFYTIFVIALYFVIMFFLAHYFWMDNNMGGGTFNDITQHMISNPLELTPFPTSEVLSFGLIIALLFLCAFIQLRHRMRFNPGKEEGSAQWNEDMSQYNRNFTEPFGEIKASVTDEKNVPGNMLLTQNVFLSMDTRKTRLNNNILVVGGSGTGKSRFFVKPNILQRNCSYVVTDPSGELLSSTGQYLENNGYDVKVFNLVEMENSNRYNPFMYIRDDNGVNTMINTLITNTTPADSKTNDPFWEKAETTLLMAICFYLNKEIVMEDQNFENVLRLVLLAQVSESNERYVSPFDHIFQELKDINPIHPAVKYYDSFKQSAGKTAKSILVSCSTRLNGFNLPLVCDLTGKDDIDLMSVGDKPTAIFVVIPSANTTYNYLVSIMYSQLFEGLYYKCENDSENCPDKHLKYHTRFLLDEFANIGTIPNFDKVLATVRKYEISCSIILQNMAQIKAMYKDEWEGIVGNCDSFLFLGSGEQSTTEYISKRLGKATILGNNYTKSKGQSGSFSTAENFKGRDLMTPDEISRMDNNYAILFIRGLLPFYDRKYSYTNHPEYKNTGDADPNLNYPYRQKFEERRRNEAETRRKAMADRIQVASQAKDDDVAKEEKSGNAAQSLPNKIREQGNGYQVGRQKRLQKTTELLALINELNVSDEDLSDFVDKITTGEFDAQFEFLDVDKKYIQRVFENARRKYMVSEASEGNDGANGEGKNEKPAEKKDTTISDLFDREPPRTVRKPGVKASLFPDINNESEEE